jgi:predicted HD superfamily hydrolase involved in NAD metabolism
MGCMSSLRRTCLRLLRERLGRRRRRHCRRTAATAARLAPRFGVDPGKAFLAGLAHDLARELGEEQLLRLAASDGQPIEDWEAARPVLLHGRAAAVLLAEADGFSAEVRQAVAEHVTGKPGMAPLSRLVFVADLLEPGRRFVRPAERRRVASLPPDRQVAWAVQKVLEYLGREGLAVAPPARALYEELCGNVATQAQVG